jgi:hypothetical protein
MLVPVAAMCALYATPLAVAVCALAWYGARQAECAEYATCLPQRARS